MTAQIVDRRIEYECAWLAVEAKDVEHGASTLETFYSVRTHDYAVVLALTADGTIPLVRQFRPAIEERSLELPSGLVEVGEDPADAVRRELLEETGCRADEVRRLGRFVVDSGRMQTVEWAFFAPAAIVVADDPSGEEHELEVVFVTPAELRRLILDGEFGMAAHVAVVGAALIAGLIS